MSRSPIQTILFTCDICLTEKEHRTSSYDPDDEFDIPSGWTVFYDHGDYDNTPNHACDLCSILHLDETGHRTLDSIKFTHERRMAQFSKG